MRNAECNEHEARAQELPTRVSNSGVYHLKEDLRTLVRCLAASSVLPASVPNRCGFCHQKRANFFVVMGLSCFHG